MGTRASFWTGDPTDEEERTWLGCIAWDGYPDGQPKDVVRSSGSKDEYLENVQEMAEDASSFADPSGGWPFPWDDDIFVTDFTYAWFSEGVQIAAGHSGFLPADKLRKIMRQIQRKERSGSPFAEAGKLESAPAPEDYDRSQPDSIMMIST